MHDIKYIRENFENFKKQISKRNSTINLKNILDIDKINRQLIQEKETLEKQKKDISKSKDEKMFKRSKEISSKIKELLDQQIKIKFEIDNILSSIPNIPHQDVPEGSDEKYNKVIETKGEIKTQNFKEKSHYELGEKLGMLDFDLATKTTGSRFVFVKDKLATLERAISNFMIDTHTKVNGYSEISPPLMASENTMFGTGQLPKFANTMFKTTDGRWLIPTAEVPVTNMYSNEILQNEDLPIHHTAYSPCFRNEQFSAGSAVRGIKRGYQFDKVEMVRFERPTESWQALEKLLENALELVRALGFKYRVLKLASKDLTFASAMTYDIEIWAPGSKEWFEVSSISNFLDFQARRANLRFRNAEGKVDYLHTLNGSGLAVGRTLIGIMENYQNSDGSITIPNVLRPYMNNLEKIQKN